jgi:ribonuclease HI
MNRMKTKAVTENGWNGWCRLTPAVLGELLWWDMQLATNKPAQIRVEGPMVTLYTDASPQGWGGWIEREPELHDQQWYVQGIWKEETQHSSNYHEMLAVFLCLKHFLRIKKMEGVRRIMLRTDNTTVMYDVNKRRGAASLLHPLKLIMHMLESHGMEMKATHIPGVENRTADSLSRLARSGDYSLKQQTYDKAVQRLRVQPTMDLFANSINRKCQRYATTENDAGATERDAFSLAWRDSFFLSHPPIPLILRCLRKIVQDRTRGVMVVPAWLWQAWSALLQRVTIRQIEIGQAEDILQPGPQMIRTGTQLPPGTILMCLVDGSTNSDGTCGIELCLR